MLELKGVSKSFGSTTAVQAIDLSVSTGQTTALLGPSGCGKSTLLRMMIGLINPDSGEIHFDGTRLTAESALAARLKMGYVIQDGGLFPHLTANQNVAIVARFLKWNEERILGRLETLRELTHFPADGMHRYPAQLSGGQQQRVSLMRALMLDPDLLLLDEPLGALDPMIRAELQTDLRDIFRRLEKTVVLVTHDIGEAAFLADTILLMRDGAVEQSGTFTNMIEQPASEFVTAFIKAQRFALAEADRA
jgi:osmoprotectant transport system ATP-binding protein